MTPENKSKLLKILGKLYSDPRSELNFRTPYELVVSVSLSAQCTDKKVNETTPALFREYPSFKALARAKVSKVEEIIRPINYYRTKAKNIIAMAAKVTDTFGGSLPHTHEELTTLPGVGRKTANVVLGELKIQPCIPVDTHVFRVARRLGLASGKTPEKVEMELQHAFKPARWYEVHHWFITHGRRVCKAQRPDCTACKISTLCPSKQ